MGADAAHVLDPLLAGALHTQGLDQRLVANFQEGHVGGGRVLLVEPVLISGEVGVDLGAAPGHLLEVEPEGGHVLLLLGAHLEAGRHLAAVLPLHEPGDEHRHEVGFAGDRQRPHLVEQVAQAIGGRLEDHLAARQQRHGLPQARHDLLGVGPERHLGAMQVLHCVGAAGVLRARGGHLVAAAQLGERQLVTRVGLDRRLQRRVAQLVVGLRHPEQVLRGGVQVRQDHRPLAEAHAGALVEARRDIGRAALLTALEHQGPHPATVLQLLLELGVQQALGVVPLEGNDVAFLRADLEVARAVQLVVLDQLLQQGVGVGHGAATIVAMWRTLCDWRVGARDVLAQRTETERPARGGPVGNAAGPTLSDRSAFQLRMVRATIFFPISCRREDSEEMVARWPRRLAGQSKDYCQIGTVATCRMDYHHLR
ncbi:hypothetical protein D3C78_1002810 [compost metagenome]